MKTLLLLVLTCFAFTGCSSIGGSSTLKPAERLAVGPLLDRIVPADFEGDGEFTERGQYLVMEVRVGGLKRRQNGAWTWKWLEYRRTLTIPVFSGMAYHGEAWIKLGAPTPPQP
jgi:hypothetical protein